MCTLNTHTRAWAWEKRKTTGFEIKCLSSHYLDDESTHTHTHTLTVYCSSLNMCYGGHQADTDMTFCPCKHWNRDVTTFVKEPSDFLIPLKQEEGIWLMLRLLLRNKEAKIHTSAPILFLKRPLHLSLFSAAECVRRPLHEGSNREKRFRAALSSTHFFFFLLFFLFVSKLGWTVGKCKL